MPSKVIWMATFTDSLTQAPHNRLVALLAARPDLAAPSPGTLFSLAARATNATSLNRALTALDTAHLQVLEAVWALAALDQPVTEDLVVRAICGPGGLEAERAAIAGALSRLDLLALVWAPEPGALRPAPGIEEALGRFPCGLGAPANPPLAGPVAPIGPDAPRGVAKILDAMVWGPPVGIVPPELHGGHKDVVASETVAALRWLLEHDYLRLLDPNHVTLPREVAFALRGHRTHQALATAPDLTAGTTLAPEQIRAEGAAAAAELVCRIASLIGVWEAQPAPALRAGGLPVRELKALATSLNLTTDEVQEVAELAFAARLVRVSDTAPHVFAPTTAASAWLEEDLPERWSHVVTAWLGSARTPWRIGQLDDKAQSIAALAPANHEGSIVRLRAAILRAAATSPGHALTPNAVQSALEWHTPRAVPSLENVTGLLAECRALGITGAGALLPGLLAAGRGGWSFTPAGALTDALPEPVSEIFIQGDSTAVVLGRPSDALETLLTEAAQVESRGGALTVRFTAGSIMRAFDAGRTPQGLLDELAMYSRTPIPQPLEYLIKDTARGHGQVRVGALSSYLRVSDPAALAAILANPALRALGAFELAPGVLGASAPIGQVLSLLRQAGLAPAVEDPDGQIITSDRLTTAIRLPNHPERVGIAGLPAHTLPPATLLADHEFLPHRDLDGLVTQLVLATTSDQPMADGAGPSHPDVMETGLTLTLLREAISSGTEVMVDLVDSRGKTTRRRLKPLSIDSGRLRAADLARESELTVSVHRIAGAQPI